MGYDKVIDSAKLDADLTTVADAIRARAGTTGEMAFPDGYVSALEPLVNGEDYLASVCNLQVTEIINTKITRIPTSFQQDNKNLLVVELPNLETMPGASFYGCTNLIRARVPKVTKIQNSEFGMCTHLKSIVMESLTTIENYGYVFNSDVRLEKVWLPVFTGNFPSATFTGCQSLKTLILGGDVVTTLASTNVFQTTPIAGWSGQKGYIYVKAALVDEYKSATNWSNYADQIRAIEDYPEVLEGWE